VLLIIADVDLDDCQVSPLRSYSSPSLHTKLSGRNSVCSAHAWGISEQLHKYLEHFLLGNLSVFLYLVNPCIYEPGPLGIYFGL
jgi:hypothetical protein